MICITKLAASAWIFPAVPTSRSQPLCYQNAQYYFVLLKTKHVSLARSNRSTMVSSAPKNFHGSKPDMEDADEFIDEVEHYVLSGHGNLSSEEITKNQDTIEPDLIRVFRHHLEGQARKWYYTTPKELRQSWSNLKSLFLATFPSRALEMDEYKKGLRRAFENLEQLPNESVSDYMYRWEVLARQMQCLKVPASDPDFLISQVCAGIRNFELSHHILRISGGSKEIPFSLLRKFSNLIEAEKVDMERRGIHPKLKKPA